MRSPVLVVFIRDLSKSRKPHCLKQGIKDTGPAESLRLLAKGQQQVYKQEINLFSTSVFTEVMSLLSGLL